MSIVRPLVEQLQLASILAGIFICLWGLTIFGSCLYKVLRGAFIARRSFNDVCAWQACWAMVCVTGLTFGVARANVLGVLHWGPFFAGWIFFAGMLCLIINIGVAIWAAGGHGRLEDVVPPTKLARIFLSECIILVSFTLVGYLHT